MRCDILFIWGWTILLTIFKGWWRRRSLYANELLLSTELFSRKHSIVSTSHVRGSHVQKHRTQACWSHSIRWYCCNLMREVGAALWERNVQRIPHYVWLSHWVIGCWHQWMRRGLILWQINVLIWWRRYHYRGTIYVRGCWWRQYHCHSLLVLLLLEIWSRILLMIPVRILLFIIFDWTGHRIFKLLLFLKHWLLWYYKWGWGCIIDPGCGWLMYMSLHYSLSIHSIPIGCLIGHLNASNWTIRPNVQPISETILHVHWSVVLVLIHWFLRFHSKYSTLHVWFDIRCSMRLLCLSWRSRSYLLITGRPRA